MWIRTFSKFLEVSELSPRALRGDTVVVDGHTFFFLSYEQSGLAYTFGCESDRYAAYLRNYLRMFHNAGITCYFLFKGGWQDMQTRLDRNRRANIKRPIFTKQVIFDVLNEYKFQYAICEYESKNDVIALAQRLDCPIVSFNLEYCFSGHPYVPSPTLEFNESDKSVHCGQFLLADFLNKHNLTADKMSIFIVLRDELIFPPETFNEFFKYIHARPGPYKRNLDLLAWLPKYGEEQIMMIIFKFISAEEKKKFVEEEKRVRQLIERRELGGLGAACLLQPDAASVARADPRWFAKGVARGHVAIEYVDLYRSKHYYGSHAPADDEQDDPMFLSLEIIKYAYDLLTNYENDGFNLVYDKGMEKETMVVGDAYSIRKPAYEAEVCVFENGWESLSELGLLEHFACSALGLQSLRGLERAPRGARLLLLALAYFTRRRPTAPAALPAAALLSYVMLDVVNDKAHEDNLPKFPFERKPILDSITDPDEVTAVDCNIAAAIMRDYFTVRGVELDRKLLHSLVEFQQCLSALAALSALCGAPLPAPAWPRTYNATLVYNTLHAARHVTDPVHFLDELLSPAPTVYAFYNGLHEAYEDLL